MPVTILVQEKIENTCRHVGQPTPLARPNVTHIVWSSLGVLTEKSRSRRREVQQLSLLVDYSDDSTG